ncbi:MAG: serine/threonine protein kinase [Acidimicrobiales bacterium]
MELHIDGLEPIAEIGRGGFGVVHLARDVVHGRSVAVKTLPRLTDEGARRRFDRERRAMGSLSGHPHIGVIHTSGVNEVGDPYIVMELLGGGSLGDRIAEGPMPVGEVIDIGLALADALAAAHTAGVLHLDMKPDNVLMSDFGRPKIVDFGIAALVDDDTATTTIRATPAYADPEVLDGRPSTPASDVYGLAATLYALLTGQAPYSLRAGTSGESSLGILRRVAVEPVPRIERADVPAPLADLLQRAMAKHADERPASMADFAAALAALGSTGAGSANPGGDHTAAAAPPTVSWSTAHAAAVAPADPEPPTIAAGTGPPVASRAPAAPAASEGRTGHMIGLWLLGAAAVLLVVAVLLATAGSDDEGDRTASGAEGGVTPAETTEPAPTEEPPPTPETNETTTPVPSVVGLEEDDARALLSDAGLVPRTEPHCFLTVSSQSPPADTLVAPQSTVTLGFDECTVPDLVGLRLPQATELIEEINAIAIEWPAHCDDLITGQSVPAGTIVASARRNSASR